MLIYSKLLLKTKPYIQKTKQFISQGFSSSNSSLCKLMGPKEIREQIIDLGARQ